MSTQATTSTCPLTNLSLSLSRSLSLSHTRSLFLGSVSGPKFRARKDVWSGLGPTVAGRGLAQTHVPLFFISSRKPRRKEKKNFSPFTMVSLFRKTTDHLYFSPTSFLFLISCFLCCPFSPPHMSGGLKKEEVCSRPDFGACRLNPPFLVGFGSLIVRFPSLDHLLSSALI